MVLHVGVAQDDLIPKDRSCGMMIGFLKVWLFKKNTFSLLLMMRVFFSNMRFESLKCSSKKKESDKMKRKSRCIFGDSIFGRISEIALSAKITTGCRRGKRAIIPEMHSWKPLGNAKSTEISISEEQPI